MIKPCACRSCNSLEGPVRTYDWVDDILKETTESMPVQKIMADEIAGLTASSDKLRADLKNAEVCVKWHREKLLRLSEENGRLRDLLKSIPTILTELSQVLRKAPGDEALRIAEHDACLIAIGFMKGPVDKILSNLPETERHLKIRDAERAVVEDVQSANWIETVSGDWIIRDRQGDRIIKSLVTLNQLQKESEGK
jgi:hypothetical protein